MKISLQRWTSLAGLGLMVISLTSTGCKTGWKMPGKDMFAWGKKPTESTLAGQGPSTVYPTSPAQSNTPSQIASGSRPSTPGYPTSGAATPGYTAPGYPPSSSYAATGYPKSGPTSPGMGGAATANGYQTGPYGMSGAANAPANAYAGMSGQNSTYGAPAAAAYGATASQLAAQVPPNIQSYGGAGSGNMNPYRPGATATAGQVTASTQPSFAAPTSGYAANNSYQPAVANAYATGGQTTGTPASYSPSSSSNPYAVVGGSYRPGSTGRATSYDFAQPAAQGSQPATYAAGSTSTPSSVPQFTAPAATPMTANAYNNPAYSPSSTPNFAPPPSIVR